MACSKKKLAGRFQCTQSYLNRVIKSMEIQKYKKQKISDRSDQQKEVNRAKCTTLYRKYRDREWILDDERYFTKIYSTINGNDNLYSDNIDFASTNVKLRRKQIREDTSCQSHSSISEPFVMASGNAVDQFAYRYNCLAPRLLPFINKNHSDGNYIFWPNDL